MSSREYYGLHNTRDFNKGKSFRYSFEWNSNGHYFNDEYVQDFISLDGKMYVCIKSNVGIEPTNTTYWQFLMEGQKGEKGDTGTLFIPSVDTAGNISWSNDAGLPNPPVTNIKGDRGVKGDTGDSAQLRSSGSHIQWKGTADTVWQNLVALSALKGDKGDKGERGLALEFIWDGTRLGVRAPGTITYEYMNLKGDKGNKGDKGLKGDKGDKGDKGVKGDKGDMGATILLQVSTPDAFGKRYLQKRYDLDAQWENMLDLEELRGPRGYSIIVERNLTTNNIEYRYENEAPTANRVLVYKQDIMGPKGDSIAKMYIADDGYLYVLMNESTVPYRAGYVRGDRGEDGREIVLRIDNDKNMDDGESGTGTHLQWKYAGDEYKLWTNLIQINELFNIALAGLKLEYEEVEHEDENGIMTTYEKIILSSWKTEYDANGNLVLTEKLNNISYIEVPVKTLLYDVYYDELTHEIVFVFSTSQGDKEIRVPVDPFYEAGNGIQITTDPNNNYKVFNVKVDETESEKIDGVDILSSTMVDKDDPTKGGVKVTGLIDKIIRSFELFKDGDTPAVRKYINEIPVGYNLKGKTITFINTTKKFILDQVTDASLTANGGQFIINAKTEPTLGIGTGIINITTAGVQTKIAEFWGDPDQGGVERWHKTSYTIPSDKDYIVSTNDLATIVSHDSVWGFNEAYVIDSGNPPKFRYRITAIDGTLYEADFPAMNLLADAKYDEDTHTLHLYFYDDVGGVYHDVPINLDGLVDIYGVTPDGGLGITNNQLFFIKEKGVVESMLSEALQKMLHDHTRVVTYDELLNLKLTNVLEPGLFYVMTDYQTVYESNDGYIIGDDRLGQDGKAYPSAVWTMVLQALSVNVLDEQVSILEHPELTVKYRINAFDLCNVTGNKGEIYYMKDDWENECGYDFWNVRWWKSRAELVPDWSTLTPTIEIDLPGIYCYTFTRIESNNTSINLLDFPSHRVHGTTIGLRKNIPVTATQGTFRNNVIISQYLTAGTYGSIENWKIESGENNLIYCVNRTYHNSFNGANNSIFCNQYVYNRAGTFSTCKMSAVNWISNVSTKYMQSVTITATNAIQAIDGDINNSTIKARSGSVVNVNSPYMWSATIEANNITGLTALSTNTCNITTDANIQGLNLGIVSAATIKCTATIFESVINSLLNSTIDVASFAYNNIQSMSGCNIKCGAFTVNTINRMGNITVNADGLSFVGNNFTQLNNCTFNNTFRDNIGSLLSGAAGNVAQFDISVLGCTFENQTNLTGVVLDDTTVDAQYLPVLSSAAYINKRLGKLTMSDGVTNFVLLQYLDADTLTNQIIKLFEI